MLRRGILVGLLVAATLAGAASARAADRFVFNPEADTYVDSSQPATALGAHTSLHVDASPSNQAFLRFQVVGISGRTVTDVRLRLFQEASSISGGMVYPLASTGWDESTTWDTRPIVQGPPLAIFGAVQQGSWYEAPLGPVLAGDGSFSLALDTINTDSAVWSSRESITPPQLIVEVASIPGLVLDGLSQVASPNVGSSDPTYFANGRRLARTAQGRLLTIFGRHSDGVQLAWRDPGSGWQSVTRGSVTDGIVLGGTKTGDWPASIAVARGRDGQEHAWVVWAGNEVQTVRSLQMRRLSDLDSPQGPTVGPIVTIDSPSFGDFRPDIAFAQSPDGSFVGCVIWTRRASATKLQVLATWFDDLETDSPSFRDTTVVVTEGSPSAGGTLVPAGEVMRLVARVKKGGLRLFESASGPGSRWRADAAGSFTPQGRARPSAVRLSSGAILAAVESDDKKGIVTVLKFSASGAKANVSLSMRGYAEPTIASDGTRAWLVAIRKSDGYIVSRQFSGRSWDKTDRVEIGPEGGGNYSWPNLLRETDGRLRLVVRGPDGVTPVKSAVLAYQRLL